MSCLEREWERGEEVDFKDFVMSVLTVLRSVVGMTRSVAVMRRAYEVVFS